MLHSLDAGLGATASTVRNGFKWADLEEREQIELCVCTRDPETHDVQGTGVVLALWFGYFKDIPARLLKYEHEVRSREYSGLLDSMRKAYGDTFNEVSPVTVIVYRRIK
jgi:hypothetical protein